MIAEAPPLGAQIELSRLTNLLQTAATARSTAITEDDLVSRAREASSLQEDNPWPAMVLAMALYRAGELEEAQDVISPIHEIASHVFARPQAWYVKSIVSSALGAQGDAALYLDRGESLYKQACLESLSYRAVNSEGDCQRSRRDQGVPRSARGTRNAAHRGDPSC